MNNHDIVDYRLYGTNFDTLWPRAVCIIKEALQYAPQELRDAMECEVDKNIGNLPLHHWAVLAGHVRSLILFLHTK